MKPGWHKNADGTFSLYDKAGKLLRSQDTDPKLSKEKPDLKVSTQEIPKKVIDAHKGTPKKGESYDVYDPETMKAAEDKGYKIGKIDESVRYTGNKVGSQSIWDPESGFYYTQGAPKPNLDKYMEHHKEAIATYTGGAEAWKKDHLKAANTKDSKGRYGRNDAAIKHVITKTDDDYFNATGKRLLDRTKEDWDVPGVQLYNLPSVGKAKPKTPPEKVKINPSPPGGPAQPKVPFVSNPPVGVRKPAKGPWWLQDIVKTMGAAGDLMRVKKYLPWQAQPETYLPDATFYDPTRELASNAEQANIQTQGMAAYMGPQALSARSSSIQGQALKNAADIESRYNNLNVGIANQLNQERTGIMNNAAQNKANLDTQLWDKYTIANQQFDSSKNMARQQLRQSYIDAITNRAKAQALNSLYPNYHTDPMSGGMIDYIATNEKIGANRPDLTNDYWNAVALTGSRKDALKYLELQKRGKIDDEYGYLPQQGYPMGKQSTDQ